MKVMMLILETPEDFASRPKDSPAAAAYWQAWNAYADAVNEKIVGGNILDAPSSGVTLRVRDGQRRVQDGPYADSKEGLGGYILFEVADLEEAIELAASCPAAATGALELRPVVPQMS